MNWQKAKAKAKFRLSKMKVETGLFIIGYGVLGAASQIIPGKPYSSTLDTLVTVGAIALLWLYVAIICNVNSRYARVIQAIEKRYD